MSGIALIGAVLAVLILNIIPSVLTVELTGRLHLLYILVSLFIGVITYQTLKE